MSTVLINHAWPDAVPLPFLDYSGAMRNTTLVSGLENGRISRRSRMSRAYAALSATWVLGVAEFDLFQVFVDTTLGNGTALFSIDLKYPLNATLTNWACRFRTEYQAQYVDGLWQVGAEIDLVLETVLSTDGTPEESGLRFLLHSDSSSGADDEELVTSDGDTYYVAG